MALEAILKTGFGLVCRGKKEHLHNNWTDQPLYYTKRLERMVEVTTAKGVTTIIPRNAEPSTVSRLSFLLCVCDFKAFLTLHNDMIFFLTNTATMMR